MAVGTRWSKAAPVQGRGILELWFPGIWLFLSLVLASQGLSTLCS